MALDHFTPPSLSAPESIKHRVLLDNIGADIQDKPTTFSFVTYNVLADCHAQRDYASSYDPQHISADFRHDQIIQELEYLNGDIICLQEVTPDFYNDKLKDKFERNGYVSLYLKRIGTYDEGCATFYRKTKFECQTSELIHLNKATDDLLRVSSGDEEEQVDITDATRQKAAERYAMQDVAILTQLKCRETKQVVTVVNTHVDFGEFKKPDLQILQVSCLKWILNERFGDSSAILCGDFNMDPNSPQYIFTSEGALAETQWDRIREIAQIENDLVDTLKKVVQKLDDKLQYRSMYKHLKGEEPDVTCVDHIYRHCLDYVFYREQLPSSTNTNFSADKEISQGPSNREDEKEPRWQLSPLQILDTLPLDHVLKNVPPSDIYSSDHFPLFVKFAIRLCN